MDNFLAQYMMQQPTGPQDTGAAQEPYNPFNNGIQRAIQTARQSFAITREQKEAALRNSLLAFGAQMGREPVKKGFFNNFGAAARALSPAISTYDQSEQQAMQQNQALAQQLIAYRQQEEARKAQEEERQWRHQMAEDQFNEQKRQHDLLHNFRLNQAEAQQRHNDSMQSQPINNLSNQANIIPLSPKELESVRKEYQHNDAQLKKIDQALNWNNQYKASLIAPALMHQFHKLNTSKEKHQRIQGLNNILSEYGDNAATLKWLKEQDILPESRDNPDITARKLTALKQNIEMEQQRRAEQLRNGYITIAPQVAPQESTDTTSQDVAASEIPPEMQPDEQKQVVIRGPNGEELQVTVDKDGMVSMTDHVGTRARVKLENVVDRLTNGAILVQ